MGTLVKLYRNSPNVLNPDCEPVDAADVTLSENRHEIHFYPSGDLVLDSTYYIVCSDQLEADSERTLVGGHVSSFRTETTPGLAPQIDIEGITPNYGSISGGTPVNIQGTDFEANVQAFFDGKPAACDAAVLSGEPNESDYVNCLTPEHDEGPVTVRVLNPDSGKSDRVIAGFVYLDMLDILYVQPAVGRLDVAQIVEIEGEGFISGPAGDQHVRVFFGENEATAVQILSTNRLRCTVPTRNPGEFGFVDVRLERNNATEPDSPKVAVLPKGYLYSGIPTVAIDNANDYDLDPRSNGCSVQSVCHNLGYGETRGLELHDGLLYAAVFVEHKAEDLSRTYRSYEELQNRLYASSLNVVSLGDPFSDLTEPDVLGAASLPLPLNAVEVVVKDYPNGNSFAFVAARSYSIEGIEALYEGEGYLAIFDVTNPDAPAFKKAMKLQGQPFKMVLKDNLLVVANNPGNTPGILFIDVGRLNEAGIVDPYIAEVYSGSRDFSSLAFIGDQLYATGFPGSAAGLFEIDLDSPTFAVQPPAQGSPHRCGLGGATVPFGPALALADCRFEGDLLRGRELGPPDVEKGNAHFFELDVESDPFQTPKSFVPFLRSDHGSYLDVRPSGNLLLAARDMDYLDIWVNRAGTSKDVMDAVSFIPSTLPPSFFAAHPAAFTYPFDLVFDGRWAVVSRRVYDSSPRGIEWPMPGITVAYVPIPNVIDIWPKPDERGVPLQPTIKVAFSTLVFCPGSEEDLSNCFGVYDGGGREVAGTHEWSIAGIPTLNNAGDELSFTPAQNLTANAKYGIYISQGFKKVNEGQISFPLVESVVSYFNTGTTSGSQPLKLMAVNPPVVVLGAPVELTITAEGLPELAEDIASLSIGGKLFAISSLEPSELKVQVSENDFLDRSGALRVALETVSGAKAMLEAGLVVLPPLSIESVTPSRGPAYGGTLVEIAGSGFYPGRMNVKFGENAVSTSDISVLSPESMTVHAPAGRVGKVPVTIERTGFGEPIVDNGVTYEYSEPIRDHVSLSNLKMYDIITEKAYAFVAAGPRGLVVINYSGLDRDNIPYSQQERREFIDEDRNGVDDRILSIYPLDSGMWALGVDLYIEQNYDLAYVVATRNPDAAPESREGWLYTIDVHNPAAVSLVRKQPLDSNLAAKIRVDGMRGLVAAGNRGLMELHMVNHYQPFPMDQLLGQGSSEAVALDVKRDMAVVTFAANYNFANHELTPMVNHDVVKFVDVSAGLQEVGECPGLSASAVAMKLLEQPGKPETETYYAYLAMGDNGVRVIRKDSVGVDCLDPDAWPEAHFTDFECHTATNSDCVAHDVRVVGNLCYVAFGAAGILVFDISEPEPWNLRYLYALDSPGGVAVSVNISHGDAFEGDYGDGTGEVIAGYQPDGGGNSYVEGTNTNHLFLVNTNVPNDGLVPAAFFETAPLKIRFNKKLEEGIIAHASIEEETSGPASGTWDVADHILSFTFRNPDPQSSEVEIEPGSYTVLIDNYSHDIAALDGSPMALNEYSFEFIVLPEGVDLPRLDDVSPPVGPSAGGRAATIVGAGFDVDVDVLFGANEATKGQIETNRMTATTPAGAGLVTVSVGRDVSFETPGRSYNIKLVDRLPGAYYYQPNMVLTGITPKFANPEGGTSYVLRGAGFMSNYLAGYRTQVMFDGAIANSVNVISSSRIDGQACGGDFGPATVLAKSPVSLDEASLPTDPAQFSYGMPAFKVDEEPVIVDNNAAIAPVALEDYQGYTYAAAGTYEIGAHAIQQQARFGAMAVNYRVASYDASQMSLWNAGPALTSLPDADQIEDYFELVSRLSYADLADLKEDSDLLNSLYILNLVPDSLAVKPHGDLLYVANGKAGLQILNSSPPDPPTNPDFPFNPAYMGIRATQNGLLDVIWVDALGDLALAVGETPDIPDEPFPCALTTAAAKESQLTLLYVGEGKDPVVMQTLDTAGRPIEKVSVDPGGRYIVAAGNSHPSRTYHVEFGYNCAELWGNLDGHRFATGNGSAQGGGSVTVYKLQDRQLTAVASRDLGYPVMDAVMAGNYVYAALAGYGLKVLKFDGSMLEEFVRDLDGGDGAFQVTSAHVNNPGSPWRLRYYHGLVMMATLGGSVMLFDVADPANPTLFSAGNVQKAYDMLPKKEGMAVASGENGLIGLQTPFLYILDSHPKPNETVEHPGAGNLVLSVTLNHDIASVSGLASNYVAIEGIEGTDNCVTLGQPEPPPSNILMVTIASGCVQSGAYSLSLKNTLQAANYGNARLWRESVEIPFSVGPLNIPKPRIVSVSPRIARAEGTVTIAAEGMIASTVVRIGGSEFSATFDSSLATIDLDGYAGPWGAVDVELDNGGEMVDRIAGQLVILDELSPTPEDYEIYEGELDGPITGHHELRAKTRNDELVFTPGADVFFCKGGDEFDPASPDPCIRSPYTDVIEFDKIAFLTPIVDDDGVYAVYVLNTYDEDDHAFALIAHYTYNIAGATRTRLPGFPPKVANEIQIRGDQLYVASRANGPPGFSILDFYIQEDLNLVADLAEPTPVYGLDIVDDLALLAADTDGLQIVDIRDSEHPWVLKQITDTEGGSYAGVEYIQNEPACDGPCAVMAVFDESGASSNLRFINLSGATKSVRTLTDGGGSYLKVGDVSATRLVQGDWVYGVVGRGGEGHIQIGVYGTGETPLAKYVWTNHPMDLDPRHSRINADGNEIYVTVEKMLYVFELRKNALDQWELIKTHSFETSGMLTGIDILGPRVYVASEDGSLYWFRRDTFKVASVYPPDGAVVGGGVTVEVSLTQQINTQAVAGAVEVYDNADPLNLVFVSGSVTARNTWFGSTVTWNSDSDLSDGSYEIHIISGKLSAINYEQLANPGIYHFTVNSNDASPETPGISIDDVRPRYLTTGVAAQITITGKGFSDACNVEVGGPASLGSVNYLSDTQIEISVTLSEAGPHSLTVRDCYPSWSRTVEGGLVGLASLTVSRTDPKVGPLEGGNTIVLEGEGFVPGLAVEFIPAGGSQVLPASGVKVLSHNFAVLVVPSSNTPGFADVRAFFPGDMGDLFDLTSIPAISAEPYYYENSLETAFALGPVGDLEYRNGMVYASLGGEMIPFDIYGNLLDLSTAQRRGLAVVDMSDPSDPQVVAEEAANGFDGIAASSGRLRIVRQYADAYGPAYAYLAMGQDGLSVYDVSNPTSLEKKFHLPPSAIDGIQTKITAVHAIGKQIVVGTDFGLAGFYLSEEYDGNPWLVDIGLDNGTIAGDRAILAIAGGENGFLFIATKEGQLSGGEVSVSGFNTLGPFQQIEEAPGLPLPGFEEDQDQPVAMALNGHMLWLASKAGRIYGIHTEYLRVGDSLTVEFQLNFVFAIQPGFLETFPQPDNLKIIRNLKIIGDSLFVSAGGGKTVVYDMTRIASDPSTHYYEGQSEIAELTPSYEIGDHFGDASALAFDVEANEIYLGARFVEDGGAYYASPIGDEDHAGGPLSGTVMRREWDCLAVVEADPLWLMPTSRFQSIRLGFNKPLLAYTNEQLNELVHASYLNENSEPEPVEHGGASFADDERRVLIVSPPTEGWTNGKLYSVELAGGDQGVKSSDDDTTLCSGDFIHQFDVLSEAEEVEPAPEIAAFCPRFVWRNIHKPIYVYGRGFGPDTRVWLCGQELTDAVVFDEHLLAAFLPLDWLEQEEMLGWCGLTVANGDDSLETFIAKGAANTFPGAVHVFECRGDGQSPSAQCADGQICCYPGVCQDECEPEYARESMPLDLNCEGNLAEVIDEVIGGNYVACSGGCPLGSYCDGGFCRIDCMEHNHCPAGQTCEESSGRCQQNLEACMEACVRVAECYGEIVEGTSDYPGRATLENACQSGCPNPMEMSNEQMAGLLALIEGNADCETIAEEFGDQDDDCEGKADGVLCDDDMVCTMNDICIDEKCRGTEVIPDGSPCWNFEDMCLLNMVCQDGQCVGGEPVADEPETACSDDEPCSTESYCQAGACVATVYKNEEGEEGDCLAWFQDVECVAEARCVNHHCMPVAFTCEEDPDPCLMTQCNFDTGLCESRPTYGHSICDDGDPQTMGDFCQNGYCTGSDPQRCDDGNSCTIQDVWQWEYDEGGVPTVLVCKGAPNYGECDTGNPCETGNCQGEWVGEDYILRCVPNGFVPAGSWHPGPDTDIDRCKNYACNGNGGYYEAGMKAEGDSCLDTGRDAVWLYDPENACLTKQCVVEGEELKCKEIPKSNDAPCGPDVYGHSPNDPYQQCNDSFCYDGACINVWTLDGEDCDDGNPCTEGETCQRGDCKPEHDLSDVPCNLGECSGGGMCQNGVCVGAHAINEGSLCTHEDKCVTEAYCEGGVCRDHAWKNCGNWGGCYFEFCNSEGECVPSPLPAPDGWGCNDGNECTSNDRCAQGVCDGAPDVDRECFAGCAPGKCNTEKQCVVKYTDPWIDCSLPADCSDDTECINGHCTPVPLPGSCKGMDPNPCSVAECNLDTGECEIRPLDDYQLCDDANPQTVGDFCLAGECTGSGPHADMACDDGNSCTGSDSWRENGEGGLSCLGDDLGVGTECVSDNPCVLKANCQDLGNGMTCEVAANGYAPLGVWCPGPDNDEDRCRNFQCNGSGGCDYVDDKDEGESCLDTGRDSAWVYDSDNACRRKACVFDEENVLRCTDVDRSDGGVCGLDGFGYHNPIELYPMQCRAFGCYGGACVEEWVEDDTTCDDGNPCTVDDACQRGECRSEDAANDTPCSSASVCMIGQTCQGGQCVGGSAVPDDPPMPCTHKDKCVVEAYCQVGECVGRAWKVCGSYSWNDCYRSFCNSRGHCQYAFNVPDGSYCDDFDYYDYPNTYKCMGNGRCQKGDCEGMPVENKDCSTNSCRPGNCDFYGYCDSEQLGEGIICNPNEDGSSFGGCWADAETAVTCDADGNCQGSVPIDPYEPCPKDPNNTCVQCDGEGSCDYRVLDGISCELGPPNECQEAECRDGSCNAIKQLHMTPCNNGNGTCIYGVCRPNPVLP
ncbi:MAG: hypothetical protein C4523_19605 [Myxococcales bacterium]|nr:MAG: hypothetical protein C4523_19605 [Myxococcales bacterium]